MKQYAAHVSKVYNSAATLIYAISRRGTSSKTAQLLYDFVTEVDIVES
jgi:hypothetical protein